MREMTKDVVILTKSAKRKHYCVAGVDVGTGAWVRLVSSDRGSHGALTGRHMTYADGSECEPLDVVRVELLRAVPEIHQPENFLIDERQKLQKLGTWTIQQVLRVHPAETPDKVYHNTERYLSEEEIGQVNSSLLLVQSSWLRINQIAAPGEKPKTRANFRYNGEFYNNISLTDPAYFQAENQTVLRNVCLVVSLPDAPFDDGRYYKFIARIFPQD